MKLHVAYIALLAATPQVTHAKTAKEIAEHRAPYVMREACIVVDLLNYKKVDGDWVGGRSIWKGQPPVAGRTAQIFADFPFYTFDAAPFLYYVKMLDITARHWGVLATLDPHNLGPRYLLREVDYVVERLLVGLPVDPWTLCNWD
jgi:hypothetical protein